jgi:hypothetical protein
MSRTQPAQLNIRSSFARERAMELAMKTGMTTTRIIEEALRAYLYAAAGRRSGLTCEAHGRVDPAVERQNGDAGRS